MGTTQTMAPDAMSAWFKREMAADRLVDSVLDVDRVRAAGQPRRQGIKAPAGGWTERAVEGQLERAGMTLISLPNRDCWPSGLKAAWPEYVQGVWEAYGRGAVRMRVPVPTARQVSEMDETYEWVQFIPGEMANVRRVVLYRSLVHPINEKHTLSLRQIAAMEFSGKTTIERWHAEGIDIILRSLKRS